MCGEIYGLCRIELPAADEAPVLEILGEDVVPEQVPPVAPPRDPALDHGQLLGVAAGATTTATGKAVGVVEEAPRHEPAGNHRTAIAAVSFRLAQLCIGSCLLGVSQLRVATARRVPE